MCVIQNSYLFKPFGYTNSIVHYFTISMFLQYEAAVKHTAEVFEEALKIFGDISHGNHGEWKVKDEKDGHKCFKKRYNLGKVYWVPVC